MQIQPGDILSRKEKDGQTVWISQRLLVDVCGVSESYLKDRVRPAYKKTVSPSLQCMGVLPDTGKSWRWAKMHGGFYYALPNIPDRAPAHYRSQLPSEEELLALMNGQQVKKGSELKEAAMAEIKRRVSSLVNADDVHYYRYDSDPTFTPENARGLARSLAWLRYIRAALDTGSFATTGIRKKTEFMELCAKAINIEGNHGLDTKSSNYLYNRLKEFPTMGVDQQRRSMIPGKYGNKNAAIVGKYLLVDEITGEEHQFDIHQALMLNLYMNPGSSVKEDMLPLHHRYEVDALDFGVSPVSYRTFCSHLSRFNTRLLSTRERHGKDYFKKNVLPYVPSEKLKYAHSLFAGDGSSTIAYKYRDRKGDLKSRNLYVIMISDTASRYIAGYAPAPEGSHKETEYMTKQAVAMAAKKAGYQTLHELVTDNHGAFTGGEIKDWLGHAFNRVRTIESNNSQANPAETQFRLFKKVLKGFHNFLRSSWNASIEGQANPDHVDVKNLPDYHQSIALLEEAIEIWNNKMMGDGSTPAERWEEKHPECKVMDARQVRYLFGNSTKKYTKYLRGFIDVESVDDGKHLFEIPDFMGKAAEQIAKATGYLENSQITVRWNETGADIYGQDGAYLMTCLPASKAKQAEIEKTETHRKAETHHMERKASETNRVAAFEAQVMAAGETLRDKKLFSNQDDDEVEEKNPYGIAMATGGNKETYNGNMEGLDEEDFEEDYVKEINIRGSDSPYDDALDQI